MSVLLEFLTNPWVTHGVAFLAGCGLTGWLFRAVFGAWAERPGEGP